MINKPTVRILVNDKPIAFHYDKDGQSWIEAKEGSKYVIEINNTSNKRILCIASVDGINVINGKPAEVKPDNGYVVGPYQSIKIDGWRISNEAVKEFLFTFNKEKSYSVKLGEGKANLGIIGVALYEEKKQDLWYSTFINQPLNFYYDGNTGTTCDQSYTTITNNSRSYSNDSISLTSCCFNASIPSVEKSIDFKAGTAKGKELESKSYDVSFEAGDLITVKSIYYDSKDNLKKRGIWNEKKMPQAFKPTAFCPDI